MVSGRRWQKREDLKFKMMAPWGSSNMKQIGSQEMPRPTPGHDEGVVYLKGTGRGWCTGEQMYHSAREPGYALGQPLCIWEPVHCKARPSIRTKFLGPTWHTKSMNDFGRPGTGIFRVPRPTEYTGVTSLPLTVV